MGHERRVGERGAAEKPVYQVPTVNNMLKRTDRQSCFCLVCSPALSDG